MIMGISRRALLKSGVAATVFAPALVRHAAAAGDPIVIASMYDLSGGLEAAGKPMFEVLNFAVSEINEAGRPLCPRNKIAPLYTHNQNHTPPPTTHPNPPKPTRTQSPR